MDEDEDFEEGLAGAAERDEPIEDLDDIQVRNTSAGKEFGVLALRELLNTFFEKT